jgi:hypothetical protein
MSVAVAAWAIALTVVLRRGDTPRDAGGASVATAADARASEAPAAPGPTPSNDARKISGCHPPRTISPEVDALQVAVRSLRPPSELFRGPTPKETIGREIWTTIHELAADKGPWLFSPNDLGTRGLEAVRRESNERTVRLLNAEGWPAKARQSAYRRHRGAEAMADVIRSIYEVSFQMALLDRIKLTRYETANADVFRVSAETSPLDVAVGRRGQPTTVIMRDSLRLAPMNEDDPFAFSRPDFFPDGGLVQDDMFFSTFVRFEQIDLAPCNYTRIDGFFLHGEAWYIVYKRGLTPTGELAPPRDASRWFEGHADD